MKFGLPLFLTAAAAGALSGCDSELSNVNSPIHKCTPETLLQGAAAETVEGAQDAGSQGRRFIVKTRAPGGSLESQAALSPSSAGAETQGSKVDRINSRYYSVEFDRDMSSADVADRLDPASYEYVEPDYVVHTTLASNDADLSRQWAHSVVQSPQAWDITRGSRNVVVAVLDSGIDYSHPDLAANIWTNPADPVNGIDDDGDGLVDDFRGWNFANGNGEVKADDANSFHGTHVAGTIGAVGNNGIGISGESQLVQLMPLKFISSGGSGFTSDAIKGIDYAIAHGAHIISNSWGSSNRSQALYDAIGRAKAAGILFVAAAGNDGRDTDGSPFYPADYDHDNIVSVAASDSSDRLASFSNYGALTVDLAAPGVSIYSTKNGASYQTMSGTSMATPLVSGVLATMKALRPDLGYSSLKKALLDSVDPIPGMQGKLVSNGRINAYKALQAVQRQASNPGSGGGVIVGPDPLTKCIL